MTRTLRLLCLCAALVPLIPAVGCDNKADSTPNTALGPPPNIPPGRGEGGGPVDPNADPKGAKPKK